MLTAIKFTSFDLGSNNLLDWVIRLIVACVCGFLIGFERKTRSKEAGIRTHAIVCLAAALMMIISKYGFADQITGQDGVRGADSARIASQVVSGIGFLGAGIIFYRKDMLRGLTTAAGIWATAGIGLAIGSGMYIVGVVSTVILVLMQIILHRPFKIFRTRLVTSLRMTVSMEDESVLEKVKEIFGTNKLFRIKMVNNDNGIFAEIELITSKTFTEVEIYEIVTKNRFIKTLEKAEEM